MEGYNIAEAEQQNAVPLQNPRYFVYNIRFINY